MEDMKFEEIDYNYQFTDKDNVWHDSTDMHAANKRKEGFKVFTNYFLGMMLHYFPCYEENNEQYYHVIEEYFETYKRPDSQYLLLTAKQIQEKYDIDVNLWKTKN